MTSRLIIFTFLLSSIVAKADYDPMRLYEMIIGADKIVYGEVTELDSLTYTLKIEGSLTGKEKTIKVLRFQDWPCAWRWTNYQLGQKLFLFLKKYEGESEKFQNQYFAMSAGNEGELPLLDNFVFINGRSLNSTPAYFPDSLKEHYANERGLLISNNHLVYGSDYFGHKIELRKFIEIIKVIRHCFRLEYGEYGSIKEVRTACSQDELEQYRQEDDFFNWTYKELSKTGGNKG